MANYMNWNSKPIFELPLILRVKTVGPDANIFSGIFVPVR